MINTDLLIIYTVMCNMQQWTFFFFGRFQLALQQNEILDVFYDDYFSLADDETTFGAKSDNYLKVLHSLKPNHFVIIPTHLSCLDLFISLFFDFISFLDLFSFLYPCSQFSNLGLLSPLYTCSPQ